MSAGDQWHGGAVTLSTASLTSTTSKRGLKWESHSQMGTLSVQNAIIRSEMRMRQLSPLESGHAAYYNSRCMTELESKRIPAWAERERLRDLSWIADNLHLFWPSAQQGFETSGRGAIVTDTTTLVEHPGGKSHPFVYLTSDVFEKFHHEGLFSEDYLRLIREYQPGWEFVAVLLKNGRESAYRIGIPSERK
jgi:hypothetical protein